MAGVKPTNEQPKGLTYVAEFAPDSSNDAQLLKRLIDIAKRPARPKIEKAG